jgi:arylsulfatase A-like enzyme
VKTRAAKISIVIGHHTGKSREPLTAFGLPDLSLIATIPIVTGPSLKGEAEMLESAVRCFQPLPRLIAAVSLLVALAACTAPQKRDPNLIFSLTDDQAADLTAFMPTVQRELVDKGVSFSEAFTTNTLCCRRGTTVLRGQYVHNHSVLSNGGPQGGFPKFYQSGFEASTLATWLQGAGYRTGMFGKYLNAYPFGPSGENPPDYRAPRRSYVPPGWSDWFGFFDVPQDKRNTPYRMYDYRVNDDGRDVWYGNRAHEYQTDVLAERAAEFIRRGSKPFFLYLAPTAPHLPAVVARRHQDMFAGLRAPRSPAFNEADTTDKPLWLRRVPQLTEEDVTEVDEIYRKQAEMLLAVDELVGTLLETLRETGQLGNTYLIFSTDHGFHSGEHRLSKMKLTPYAATSRIP